MMKALLPLLLLAQQMHTGPYRLPNSTPSAACGEFPKFSPALYTSIHVTAGSAVFLTADGDCKCGTNAGLVEDTLGNTWVYTVTGAYGSTAWVCSQCHGGDDTITIHFTGSGTTSQYLIGAVNYTDVLSAAANDGNVGTYQTHDTTLTTPPLSTTHAPDRLVAVGYASSGDTVGPNRIDGFTTDLTCTYNDALTHHQSLLIASRIATSVGDYTQTTTFDSVLLPPDEEIAGIQGLKQ